MRVVFFASGGPGNFHAALQLAQRFPDLLSMELLVTDRPKIPSVALAQEHGIACLVGDFAASCGSRRDYSPGPAGDCDYENAGERFHDRVLDELQQRERASGRRYDLAVLAYRRIIRGALLRSFDRRMINQHPADLAVRDPQSGRRCYVGIGGHARQLADGHGGARTTTILVREGVDTGEILARGPWVPFHGDAAVRAEVEAHEATQKSQSDWIALQVSLLAIANGAVELSDAPVHPDGALGVVLNGKLQPYGGIEATQQRLGALARQLRHARSTRVEEITR